jgi:hypothetical protein
MLEPSISRAQMRDLAAPGRSDLPAAGIAGSSEVCASLRRPLADATSIAE